MFIVLLISAPISHELKPPANPARFIFLSIGLFSGCDGMLPFAICSVGGTPFLKPRPSARTNTQTARRSGFEAAFGQFRHKALRRERA
ncbi:hypothetical protein [Rhizobium leguminosarum]|uniref:hypothetical protein n=1 Tax=Rhizobium leguminosarum TaxID=384 RepID=UPI001040559B|nr:hypothetical protein [Rhizobium leguminosarum]TBY41883.1 hypothetical protein E0H60_07370 [Rhizobium leguminosarum bv. viciae]